MHRFFPRTAWSALVSFLWVTAPSHPAHADDAVRKITLEEALQAADASAPALMEARARRSRADAAKIAAASSWFPENPSVAAAAGPRWSDGVSVDAEVSVEQQLELFGEQGLRRAAAAKTSARIDAELAAARFRVHRDVHAAFHLALIARERKRLADEAVAFAEALGGIAKKRVDAGEVSSLQTTLADAEVAQARQTAVAAQRDLDVATLELSSASGLPAVPRLEPDGTLEIPQRAPSIDLLVEKARSHQPDLRAFAASVDESNARLAVAEREAYPKPTIGLGYSLESGFGAGPADHVLLATVAVPIPLWRRNEGPIADARADVAEADAAQRARAAQLEATLRTGKTRVDAEADRAAVFGAQVLPNASAGLEKVRRAFELGDIDILDVSVARERLLTLQREALDANEAYFLAVADLELEVGADIFEDSHSQETP